GANGRRRESPPRIDAAYSVGAGIRVATVLVSPDLQLALIDFLPFSLTNRTLCAPAETETPILGVVPSGLPSTTTLATGIEFRLSVQVPSAAAAAGAGAGAGAEPSSSCTALSTAFATGLRAATAGGAAGALQVAFAVPFSGRSMTNVRSARSSKVSGWRTSS